MQKTLLTLLLSLIAIPMLAQKITVTGTVIDATTNEGIISATVRILSLPDSSLVAGSATDSKGAFSIKNVKRGKYAIKVTYIGYTDHVLPLDLSKATSPYDAGYITMGENSKLLKEAVVSANAAQVQVSGDSLVYNANAFRTAEGSMLEELVKKLPGAEIDDDGNVTINGKTVSKILVDGKEFFLNDKNMALKNIPTSAIDKIKAYDRKSDLARVTGIDDGNEETVLDLQFKKGMNNGWFGNVDASIGTKRRYSEKLSLNRFIDHNQFSIIASTNNIGDRGFGGGGGRGWGRGGNGLSANKNIGFNFATVSDKLETGGNVRYRWDGTDMWSRSNVQNLLTTNSTYSASLSQSYSSANQLNADFRLEWKPDSMTNIIFRPSGSYSRNRGYSTSQSASFNKNPYDYSDDPLDDTELANLIKNIDSLVISTDPSRSQSYSNNRSVNGELQINRRLNNEGRNITLRVTGGASGGDSKSVSASNSAYYLSSREADINNRYSTTPSRSSNVSAQLTYSEPIAHQTYLQFSYRFNYGYSMNDRQTFIYDAAAYKELYWALQNNRYDVNAILDYMTSIGQKDSLSTSLSKYSQYRNYNHTIGLTFRKVTDKFNLSAGVELLPQHSTLSYKYMGLDTLVRRTVFNVTPAIDFRYNFNKTTEFRVNYRGRTSQPSMTDMLPITDDSNPKNIRIGNPGLKPSLSHNIRINFNTYNADLQQGIFTFGGLTFTQNSVSSRTSYDASTDIRTTTPENINGNWNGDLGLGYNRGLGASKYFTINNFARLGYNHQVSFYYAQSEDIMKMYNLTEPANIKTKTNRLDLNDRLSFGYRKDWFEASINGSVNYSHSRNSVVSTANLDTWSFSYGTEFNFNFDCGLSISTDLSESSRRGYSNSSMNTNELLWNAQASYSFLKGKALTISAQWNDILGQRSNISRAISTLQSSDTEYNAIYSYGMIHVIYKLNIFGGKNANGTAEERYMTPWGTVRAGDTDSKDSKGNRRGGMGGGRPGGPGPR